MEKQQHFNEKDGLNIDFYPNLLNEDEASELYNELETLVPFPSSTRRSNITYGDAELVYTIEWYGKVTYRKAQPWLPQLLDIKTKLEEITGNVFNICVVQRYPNGKIGIKPHRDKEMTHGTSIIGVSLGATRVLRMTGKGKSLKLSLNTGSAYCLNPPTNDIWCHSILEDNTTAPRISLTFRNYTQLPT
jgi:alkylated DNA repair dioxygenase AlkB